MLVDFSAEIDARNWDRWLSSARYAHFFGFRQRFHCSISQDGDTALQITQRRRDPPDVVAVTKA